MLPISLTEMTQLREDVAAAACDTPGVIKRQLTLTPDGRGTKNGPYTAVANVNVGLKAPTAQQLDQYAHLIGSRKAWIARFPYGTDIRELDHFVTGSNTLIMQSDISLSSYSSLTTMLAVETV